MSAIPLVVIVLASCALYGWGRLARRMAGLNDGDSWALTLALGLALLIAMGGVLNLVRLAGAWPLTGLAVFGMGLFLAPFARPGALRGAWTTSVMALRDAPGRLVLIAIAVAVLVFTVATQLPPAIYNYHDDFQKYFAHPVRMLETGTLYGSPLSAMGSESLGGMAFLHGFAAAHFPIRYINGVDAAFSLFLCLLLIAGFAWRRPAVMPTAALAMAALFAINPQYVNVSSLYTGSALVLAVIFITADPAERRSGPPSALAVGLIHAALGALKPTFLLFAALHLVFTAVAVARANRGARGGLIWGAAAAGWGVMFIAPWLALHGPHFFTALTDPVPGASGDTVPLVISLIDVFSTARLFYGASFAHYSGLMFAVLLCAVAAARHFGTKNGGDGAELSMSAAATVAAACAGLTAYLLMLHLGGPLLAGYGQALRYSIPVLIAAVPAALCLAALHLMHGRPGRLARAAPPVIALLIIAAFAPDLRVRMEQAVKAGTIFAIPRLANSERYRDYNRLMFHAGAGERIRAIQQRIPADAAILAWINTPFHLDYRRNPIIDVDIAGLTTPWARSSGARYVLWEYQGYGVRSPRHYARQARRTGRQVSAAAARGAAFAAYLRDQAGRGEFLFNDGAIAVFRLATPLRWP
jgi:hypothetical protein